MGVTLDSPSRSRRTVLMAVVMVLALVVALIPPMDSRASALLFLVPVLTSVGVMGWALRAIAPSRRGPWIWLTAAQGLFAVGEVWHAVLQVRGEGGFPTPADAIYLVTFLPMAAGLLGFNRQRLSYSYRGDLLDSGIVTVSAAVLFGVFFVLPVATDGSMGSMGRLVSSAYPVTDILMMFLLARMLTGPGARTPAFWFLMLAQVVMIGADLGYNITQLRGGFEPARWMTACWQLYYVFVALGACSATASRLTEKKPRAEGGLDVARLLVLGVAASLPSGIVVGMSLTDAVQDAGWLAAGSVVVIGLVVARIWDLLQQVRSQAVQLAALARTDPLTGIANRRTWDHEISRTCAQTLAGGTSLYVAILDMDHFKTYNDVEGHAAGDELLVEATRAWASVLAPDGFLARWGGEEFAVALPAVSAPAARARLERLLTVVPNGQTCSIGVARWDRTETPAALLRRADEALYEAKTGGRNRLVICKEPDTPAIPGPRDEAPVTDRVR
jgi:diguanylate cyclase (GGDEF)-like protein